MRNSNDKPAPARHFRGLLLAAMLLSAQPGSSLAALSHPEVEYRANPIGIDSPTPRFSWRHEAAAGIRGLEQMAYRITVRDPTGAAVWDSGKVADAHSIDITYCGSALRPETRYDWSVTAWDNQGGSSVASSWFETGLMSSDGELAGWEGATWIGGVDTDLVLYSPYLSVFKLAYTLTIEAGSEHAALVFAANDPRLMDSNKNIYQLQQGRNQSYFKLELDIGGKKEANGSLARLNVYRVGYRKQDTAATPLRSFPIKADVIGPGNAHSPHRIEIRAELGELSLSLDGKAAFVESDPAGSDTSRDLTRDEARVNLGLAVRGGDSLSYGHLSELGFAVDPDQTASFSEISVAHVRSPGNRLFYEDLRQSPYSGIYQAFTSDPASGLRVMNGAYVVSGGTSGVFVVADPSRNSMPMLRTTFTVKAKKLSTARLYITARGIYEGYLNGKRIGNDYYNPGFTQYNRTQLYQTYDVTNRMTPGVNTLGAMLGEGWWSGLLGFGTDWNHFGDRQSLLAKLVLVYEDGSREVITTNDRAWKYFNAGPIVYSSLYMGEVYDARREAAVAGWSTGQYNDRSWHPAVSVSIDGTAFTGQSRDLFGPVTPVQYDHLSIVGQIGEPARVYQVLTARSVQEVRKGVYVYDIGQNVVGVPRVSFAKAVAGQRVVLRVAEMLYPDLPESGDNVGRIMTENYRAALSQDIYIMKSGAQQFQPRFTAHGFRYLEITGIDRALPVAQVQAVVLSSVQHLTASYETSNPRINRLWSNIVWSNIGNFLTIPTDCPQRNERLGWSGDISVFSRTATYLSNAAPFLERHLLAMRDVQLASGKFTDIAPLGGGLGGVLWGSAGITVPWELYQQYADTALLREHYDAMAAYIDYLETTLDPRSGLTRNAELGDWLGPQNGRLGSAFPATAYHVYDLWIMTQVAEMLGKHADAQKYHAMYAARKAFFNKTFVSADKKALGFVRPTSFPGGPMTGEGHYEVADTQTAYAVGLALGAFSEENIPYMQRNLVASVERENGDDQGTVRPRYSLMTGFIGTAWISKALSDAGRPDVAYRLLENAQFPSWLYPVDQGATTIWERLNGYTVEKGFGGNNAMNSFNHYAFGAVGQWLMAYSLGIQRGSPGFKSFVLQPEPDPGGGITWAKGRYESPYGEIQSGWQVAHGRLIYTATIPANTTALLRLPARAADQVWEGGKPVRDAPGVTFEKFEDGTAMYRLRSGIYQFAAGL